VIRRQRADGSWAYGGNDYQSWADNFHTAFILGSLSRIIDAVGTEAGNGLLDELNSSLRRGYEFWQERFFLEHGWPKYYPDHLYPADVHSAASAIVTLVELRGRIPGTLNLAGKVADWAITNLRDERGFFYYQVRRFYKVRIPYMRWSEAWMMYALGRLLEVKSKK
jgi:hypothetical protein